MMMYSQVPNTAEVRKFVPSARGGGSKKGKPQAYWPWVLKVIADAVCVRAAGSREAWQRDRRPPFPGATWAEREATFGRAMDAMCPGWQDWFRTKYGDRATPLPELLYNRAYKASNYNGSSARGTDHDPATRVGMSSEHWSRHFPSTPGQHPFADLFEGIVHRRVVSVRWQKFLDVGKGPAGAQIRPTPTGQQEGVGRQETHAVGGFDRPDRLDPLENP